MKVMITGSDGQLGREFMEYLEDRGLDVIGFNRKQLDVTDVSLMQNIITKEKPSFIIHCAAYTKVDLAEDEIKQAYRINADAVKELAIIAERVNATLIYISTDFVFDGKKKTPYHESDRPNPISVYGQSKLVGETYVKEICSKYFIVRTSWLYGNYGPNFVRTMLTLSEKQKKLSVVDDQIGSPTYTKDLVKSIVDELFESNQYGIFHLSNDGFCSWFDFAKEIFKTTEKEVAISPVSSEVYNAKARRPAYSVLANNKTKIRLRNWKVALHTYLGELNE
ncbi:putative dTDP-4-dehydrorhamnose reductase [Bacillus sp. TS-2]|nr:putative dTDP-4-dehydrorhamnose reductase [Bacillus sp. TS-2]